MVFSPPTIRDDLLDRLYEGAVDPEQWPRFLKTLADFFGAGTATLRITDMDRPVVFRSFTAGFDPGVNRLYAEEKVDQDPFRRALAEAPLGQTQLSHRLIDDRTFERSAHYRQVFRPNGNFYAMGAQFTRQKNLAAHVGVHRPRCRGPFTEAERRQLDVFHPHLRRAARVMRLVGELETALLQARSALDQLPFGAWLLDREMRCQWANRVAGEALESGVFGLCETGGRLSLVGGEDRARLQVALTRVNREKCGAEVVPVGLAGATLVLVNYRREAGRFVLGAEENALLLFLLDPERPVEPDRARLKALYGLTQAEIRLLTQMLRGLDLNESSQALHLSLHTVRSQLKSIMAKLGVTRQAQLVRKVLLVSAALCGDEV